MRTKMIKSKYQTTILLQPEAQVKQSMEMVLSNLFWRQPDLSRPALKFLDNVKKKGMNDDYWPTFCKKEKITRGQYDSVIKKLRGSGFIYKRDNTFKLANSFEENLKRVIGITEKWRQAK